jgi:hypothetical protein
MGLAIILVARGVCAAPTEGRVRLSLEGELIGYEKATVDSASSSQTVGGLGSPSLGLGIAGGVGENVLLGGRVAFATASNDTDGSSSSATTTQFSILGIPEYVFDGDAVRPFIGAAFGYASVTNSQGGNKVSSGLGLIGGTAGAHCFAADVFSIDPSLTVLYEAGSASVNDTSRDASGFALLLGIAFSGWFGGNKAVALADAEPMPTASAPAPMSAPVSAFATPSEDEDSGPGELRAVVKLAGGARATFRIDPSQGDSVEMVVILGRDSPELVQCKELVVKTAKGDVTFGPFTPGKVGAGTEAVLTLTTTTTLGHAKALVSEGAVVKLEGCGESWDITPDQTEDVHALIKRARAYLRKHAATPQPAAPTEPVPAPTPAPQ